MSIGLQRSLDISRGHHLIHDGDQVCLAVIEFGSRHFLEAGESKVRMHSQVLLQPAARANTLADIGLPIFGYPKVYANRTIQRQNSPG
jgi:hypothetical protein